MKQFFVQRLTLALASILGSFAIIVPDVLAQAAPADATLNFQGTVGSVCVFSNVVNGVLEYDGNAKLRASLFNDPFSGTPGSVDLKCTGPAEVNVSTPQENGSASDILTNARLARGAFGFSEEALAFLEQEGSGTTASLNNSVDSTFSVGMVIEANNRIPDGVYSYNVVVTATPQ